MNGLLPRVHDANTGLFKVRDVASDDGQIVLQRGGSDKSVNPRLRLSCGQPSPAVRNCFGDWENASRELLSSAKEPFLEDASLQRVFHAFEFYPATNLGERHYANHQGIALLCSNPFFNAGLTLLPAQLRENVRVKQPLHHSPMSRVGHGSRSGRGSSSTTNSSESKCSLKDVASPAFTSSASRKMRRCSSSVDTPCSTARFFSFLTSASDIFLTSNWLMPHSAITASNRQATEKGEN